MAKVSLDSVKEGAAILRCRVRITDIVEIDDDPIVDPEYVRLKVCVAIGDFDDPWYVKVNDSKEGEYGEHEFLEDYESDFYSVEDGHRLNFREMRTLREENDFVYFEDLHVTPVYALCDCRVAKIGGDIEGGHYSLAVVNSDGEVISNKFFVSEKVLQEALV